MRRAMIAMVMVGGLAGGAARAEAGPEVKKIGEDRWRVTFVFAPDWKAKSVHLAGSFNDWSPEAAPMKGPDAKGRFGLAVELGPGAHEYKFVVDGARWAADPSNPDRRGEHANSVLYLGVPREGPDRGPPVRAEERAHPAKLAGLARAGDAAAIEAWLARHPQPLATAKTLTVLVHRAGATGAKLLVAGAGFAHEHEMKPLADGVAVFAVTLDRAQAERHRAVYRFELASAEGAEAIDPPHAATMAIEGASPGGLLAAPAPEDGRLVLRRDFADSTGRLKARDVWVWLPPGYAEPGERRYPVLYMHDGQNVWRDTTAPFANGGWRVDETAARLIAEGRVEPFIVVGVANTTDRSAEYGPGEDVLDASDHPYLRFLARDVKGWVDATFRTERGPEHTAIMGSSYGGIISFQAALADPGTWGAAACLSPSFGREDPKKQSYFDLVRHVGKRAVRLYIDSGTGGRGQDGAPHTRRMAKLRRETGWKDGADFEHFEEEGGLHNEKAWARRAHRPLTFLFGKERPKARR